MAEQRELPQNVVQATGQVATDVVGGLKSQPMILALVVLFVVGLMGSGYLGMQFLQVVKEGDQQDREVLKQLMENNRAGFIQLMSACFPEHREQGRIFDNRQDRQDR